jgi:hypothetical protein
VIIKREDELSSMACFDWAIRLAGLLTRRAGCPKQAAQTGIMTTTFATGTSILTARGEVRVETLRDGDTIETVSGAFQPVVFLGRRRVDCARHPRPRDVWPVRVQADAFADGVPRRDLLLSPGHTVYVDDVLVPIRYLINGETIRQEATELPGPDVIFAECLPCDSFPDGDNRSAFENGGPVMMLHPDFASPGRRGQAFNRLDTLAKVRRHLLDRAGSQGVAAVSGMSPRQP